jgi:CRISPR-associated protein Csx10
LLVNSLQQRKPPGGTVPPVVTTPGPLAPTDPAHSFAQRIEEEVWREQIRRAALQVANNRNRRHDLLGWHSNHPPMSQLGGLRGVVQQVRSWNDRHLVTDWLDHLAENNRRAVKWNGAISKVKELFEQEQAVWQALDPSQWPTLTVEAAARLKRDLWPLAARTLIDACIRAHKRELDQEE